MRARLLLAMVWLCAACAHGPAPAVSPAAGAPTWPPPPATARARLVAELPLAEAPETAAWWRRGVSAVLGTDDRAKVPGGVLLARPFGVAARGDELLVADADAGSVLRFHWRLGTATKIECRDKAWVSPIAVAMDRDGSAIVADGAAGRVVRVLGDGRCTEIGAGALERPTGVAISGGRVYVVDPPRHTVVAFDADGREVLRFGTHGDGVGELNFPTAIGTDPGGDLLVVDALNFRIVRFSPEGEFRSAFGKPGDVEGTFGRPKGVAAVGNSILVTDAQWDVVLVFGEDGVFKYLIGESETGLGSLNMPAGISAEGDHLFVANSQAGRVEIYELLPERP